MCWLRVLMALLVVLNPIPSVPSFHEPHSTPSSIATRHRTTTLPPDTKRHIPSFTTRFPSPKKPLHRRKDRVGAPPPALHRHFEKITPSHFSPSRNPQYLEAIYLHAHLLSYPLPLSPYPPLPSTLSTLPALPSRHKPHHHHHHTL